MPLCTKLGTLLSTLTGLYAFVPGKTSSSAFPEAEGAVADREFWRELQSAPAHVDQKLAPALGALAHANLKADQLHLALGRFKTSMHSL